MKEIQPHRFLVYVIGSITFIGILFISFAGNKIGLISHQQAISDDGGYEWQAPDFNRLSYIGKDSLIRYGRELIANTSFYLGPKGKIAALTNGMNCQNCHLDAGTRYLGNNYSAVASNYPKFRNRSGTVENIYKRINDCLERSLNAKKILDTNSREMQAITEYMKWLGKDVPKNVRPEGVGIKDLDFLDRPANPARGRMIYIQKCQRCHGVNGEGLLSLDSTTYIYPPLWGKNSYTANAGLHRLGRFAGYVRYNMPFDAPQNALPLTDEESWDVAAFVNSQPRPNRNYKNDYPEISGKPIDHPFGPYSDSFSENQHKYGPFAPIRKKRKSAKN